MSSATARFFSLLPLRHPLPFLSTARLFISIPPISNPRRFHFKPQLRSYYDPHHVDSGRDSSAWPEWRSLVSSIDYRACSDLGFGEFVDGGRGLNDDFARAASACLAFAREHEHRLWSLPREDVEAVVQNGLPFLFKDAEDTVRRMRLFLNGSTSHVMGTDKPSTVDLMKFLLSYASTTLASSGANSAAHGGIVEASVRRLFSELAVISGSPEPSYSGSWPKQVPETNGQFPGSSAQLLQMKRGDWVCPRCRFMNFARNMKCLECEESRPKRQLNGGEWECPQCDFFNYGRNTACLRCDCKKPGMINPVAGSGYDNYRNNGSSEKQFTGNQQNPQNWYSKISQLESESSESGAAADQAMLPQFGNAYASSTAMDDQQKDQDEKSQRWSKGVSQVHDTKDLPSGVSDKGFPDPMPMPKGENRFFVREKKDRSLTSPLYKRRMAMEQPASNNYVPFVPFPPDYFAKGKQAAKDESGNPSTSSTQIQHQPNINSETSHSERSVNRAGPPANQRSTGEAGNQKSTIPGPRIQNSAATFSEGSGKAGKDPEQWRGSSLEGSAVKEADPLDMSEEAKAERWFRRVAQIKDIKELSEIPDEDFPSIMPMRKGVNRFVVSKRKTPLERRLASSQYRRNLPVVGSEPPIKDVEDIES